MSAALCGGKSDNLMVGRERADNLVPDIQDGACFGDDWSALKNSMCIVECDGIAIEGNGGLHARLHARSRSWMGLRA